MPAWFEATLAIVAAIAAVFFFGKYRETVAALEESERMKRKLSKDLDRYRDVPQLRALRDSLAGARVLPKDDQGRQHVMFRDGERKLVHITIGNVDVEALDSGEAFYMLDGEKRPLKELE
ncbi:hypothetical protein [Microbulbifer aggregans]|uniref:hypothetical protein n=1 Tax=Microbulbifer aggregans TaxID=1769779 RepID=UPI001CFF40E1|nr:hypothetical protein [Microbulbifer aggregans]